MQSQYNDLQIKLFGHPSAYPSQVAQALGVDISQEVSAETDLAIFAINPAAGIDQLTIEQWQAFDEFQTPRMVVVTCLEKLEADFDDAVMIANRVFDQMITPYLVLHDDSGLPIALISLQDLNIIDYSSNPPLIRHSDEEHQTLVQEFRDEYLEQLDAAGEDAFSAGLLFPAIPIWIEKRIGLDIVKSYIEQIKK